MKKQLQLKFLCFLVLSISLNMFSQSRRTVNGALSVSPSGAANYQIAFELPSFALDIFPNLGLSYSSQSSDGIAGYGWNISGLSSITRTASVPIYDGINKEVNFDNDKFALDGQRLLIKSGTYGADGAQYETANYSNLKIISVGVSNYGSKYGPAYFVVYYPDGSKSWYGQNNNSHCRMEWGLSKIEDTNGNIVIFNYKPITSGNTLTIDSIEDEGADIVANFEYIEKTRSDQSFVYANSVFNRNLLKTVNILTNSTNTYRSYSLNHDYTNTNYARLINITEKNSEGILTKPIEFTYDQTDFEPVLQTNDDVVFPGIFPNKGDYLASTGDLNADGLTDFVTVTNDNKNVNTYYRTDNSQGAVGGRIYELNKEVKTVFTAKLNDSNNKYIEEDALVIVTKSNTLYTYNVYVNGSKILTKSKTTSETIHKHLPGDYNGDGITDVIAIRGSGTSKAYFTDFNYNSSTAIHTFVGQLATSINADFQSKDVNGDGKTDIVVIQDGKLEVWSLNQDNDLEKISSLSSAAFSLDKPLLSGDFNGDGKIDFVTPSSENSANWYFILNAGITFYLYSKPIFSYQKSEIVSESESIVYNYITYDIDNDGKTDLFKHEANLNGFTDRYTYNFALNKSNLVFDTSKSLIGGTAGFISPPGTFVKSNLTSGNTNEDLGLLYLRGYYIDYISFDLNHNTNTRLTKVDNNKHISEITYEPYLDNTIYEDLEYPLMSLKSIPNAKLVSSVTETVDYIAKTRTKQFKYFGATTHTQGLGFLGFRKVAQTNWQGMDIATLWTSTGYDANNRGIPLYTAVTESEPSNSLMPSNYVTLTELTYDTDIEENGVFISNLTNSTTNNNLTGVETSTSSTYDAYNNVSSTTNNFPGGSNVSYLFYNNFTTSDDYYWVGVLQYKTTTQTLGNESFRSSESHSYTYPKINVSYSTFYNNNYQSINQIYEYDSFGNVLKKTTRTSGLEDRVETYTYDSTGRFLESVTNNDNFTTRFNYNTLNGNLLNETDHIGRTTAYEYDGWDRITKETDYLGNWVSTRYFDSTYTGRVYINKSSSLRSDGDFESITINRSGNVYQASQRDEFGSSIRIWTEYDAIGRIKRQSAPYKTSATNWTYYYYDEYNRPFQQVDYTGKTTNLTYSGLSTTIDDGTQSRKQTTNAVGNIVQIIDDGGTIDYSYYANGSPKTTNVNGHIITNKIDGWGRKTELNDPAAGKYNYTYDNFGQLLTETKPSSTTIFDYDNGGRLVSKRTSGNNTETTTTYRYSFYKQLSSVTHQDAISGKSTSINYQYDSNLRVSSITELGVATFRRSFTYDNYGRIDTDEIQGSSRLTREGAVSEVATQNIYSPTSGMLIGIKDVDTNTTLWEAKSANEYGSYTSIDLGNGIHKSRTYDNYGYLINLSDTKASNDDNDIVFKAEYSWNTNTGNLITRKHNFNNLTETFEYDSHNRLTSVNGSKNRTISYENNGNIKTKTEIGSYTYDAASKFRIESIDLNTEGQNYYEDHTPQTVTYNAFKKPLTIHEAGNGRVDFEYGAMGSRSIAYYGGEAEDKNDRNFTKLYSSIAPIEIVFDNTNSNSKVITYLAGNAYDSPVAYLDTGSEDEFVYIHRDHLGSINAITNQDGDVIEQAHYNAWGNVEKYWDTNGNATLDYDSILGRGYTGHEHFTSVSLIHMNGRMYDSQLGRFLSPDNYVQQPFSTQSFNRYSYVMNNPLKYNDPSGEVSNCPNCPNPDNWGTENTAGGGNTIGGTPEFFEEIGRFLGDNIAEGWDKSGINDFVNQNFDSIRNDVGDFAEQTWDAFTDAANFISKNAKSGLDDLLGGVLKIGFGGGGGSYRPANRSRSRTNTTGGRRTASAGWVRGGDNSHKYFEANSQSIAGGSGGNSNFINLSSPPTSTQSFEGVLGKLNYFWNGGIENGARYNLNGDFVGPAPTMGVINPAFGPGGGINLLKYLRNPNVLKHVFRKAAGHVNPKTINSQNRFLELFNNVSKNSNNMVPTTNPAKVNAGVQTFKQAFKRGQVWVETIAGKITNAGVNK